MVRVGGAFLCGGGETNKLCWLTFVLKPKTKVSKRLFPMGKIKV